MFNEHALQVYTNISYIFKMNGELERVGLPVKNKCNNNVLSMNQK